MYLVAIGWIYVALMMALAEAVSPQGSLMGAGFTFVLYGVLPVALVLYLLGTPMRRRAIRAGEAAAPLNPAPPDAASPSGAPDGGGKPSTGAEPAVVAPVREEV